MCVEAFTRCGRIAAPCQRGRACHGPYSLPATLVLSRGSCWSGFWPSRKRPCGLLVIPAMRAVAEAARDAIPHGRERTEIILGDITRPQLGLDEATRRRMADEVDTVYHLAAIYDLATPHAISRLVNVTGTENVLDFCESLPQLSRLVYFSTAYVSGTRTGRVLEDELEQAKSWKNYYELTKWDAEVAVRRRWNRIPTVIIRPGVVVGDSRTGEINKYDGPYFIIRALVDIREARVGALEPVLLVRRPRHAVLHGAGRFHLRRDRIPGQEARCGRQGVITCCRTRP